MSTRVDQLTPESLVKVRAVRRDDLSAIAAILQSWLIDRQSGGALEEEVGQLVAMIEAALGGHASRRFVVAVDEGREILGVAGLQSDNIDAELLGAEERAIEAVTVYVRPEVKGNGVGRILLDFIEAIATDAGFTTLLVVSGSRNRTSGYPFWRRRYGEPMRYDADYFGPGQERVVWRHSL